MCKLAIMARKAAFEINDIILVVPDNYVWNAGFLDPAVFALISLPGVPESDFDGYDEEYLETPNHRAPINIPQFQRISTGHTEERHVYNRRSYYNSATKKLELKRTWERH